MAVVGFILNLPEILVLLGRPTHVPVLSDLSFTEKTNIILTVAITFFAAIEGYSTFMQVVMDDRKSKIEDARNELEKAYGPLYTILNKYSLGGDDDTMWVEPDEKNQLDEIMATYPFMFPSDIYDLWRQKVQNLGPIIDTTNLRPTGYEVYLEFKRKINEEYDRRVRRYNELLKK